MITTKDLRCDVGIALPIHIVARNFRGSPVSLVSPASIYLSVTADAKISALFTLSSLDSLSCATVSGGSNKLNTVLAARPVSSNDGTPITVALIGDSISGVSISNIGNAVTIHYQPGVSTVAQVESAIISASVAVCPLIVKTPGAGTTVLDSSSAFSQTLVTSVVVLDQISYTGQVVVTLMRERTKLLLPTGDDDPYLWDAAGFDTSGMPFTIASRSRLSMFGTSTVLPG